MATDTPTQELVSRAQGGDRAAFGELSLRFQEQLTKRVRTRMGARIAAKLEPDDLVQDAFSVALESIGKFQWRGEASFFAWLASIAEHLIWSSSQKKAWGEITLARDPSNREPSPSRQAGREERLERLERALGDLSEDHRRVVNLARLEGLEVKQIAAEMNRSPDAVKKLLARALLRLKESFGDTESLHLPDRGLREGRPGDA